jgi:hypothetical protein
MIVTFYVSHCAAKTQAEYLYYFAGEADDFDETFFPFCLSLPFSRLFSSAQFPGNRSENAGSNRVFVIVNQDRRIGIEPDVTTVFPSSGLFRADDHGFHHRPFFDVTSWYDGLYGANDDIAETSKAPPGSAKNFDAH